MAAAAEADDYSATSRKMTPELLAELCRSRGMWSQPHLNTTLFLNYKGFERIESLEEYVKVRCLHLGNNNICRIEGLERMTELKTLYLESNRITTIEGLDNNLDLRQINLEGNAITRVSGLSHLRRLDHINLSSNQITSLEALEELRDLPQLHNVDFSRNKIEDGEGVVEFFAALTEVRLLRFHGNPCIRHVANYRKRLINSLPSLGYLDERPVFPMERRSCAAWESGGVEAMHQAKKDYVKERFCELGVDPERRELLTRRRKEAIARIEREEREKAEREAAEIEKSSEAQETPVQAGELEALGNYEKSWKAKVNLYGRDGLRDHISKDASAKPAQKGSLDFRPPARGPSASDGHVPPPAPAHLAASAPIAPGAGSRAASEAAGGGQGLWSLGAADFRGGRSTGAQAPGATDAKGDGVGVDAVYAANETRQFDVLGDVGADEIYGGSAWAGAGAAATPSAVGGAALASAGRRGDAAAGSAIIPDIWQRNAAETARLEGEAIDQNLKAAAMLRAETASSRAAAQDVATSSELSNLD